MARRHAQIANNDLITPSVYLTFVASSLTGNAGMRSLDQSPIAAWRRRDILGTMNDPTQPSLALLAAGTLITFLALGPPASAEETKPTSEPAAKPAAGEPAKPAEGQPADAEAAKPAEDVEFAKKLANPVA